MELEVGLVGPVRLGTCHDSDSVTVENRIGTAHTNLHHAVKYCHSCPTPVQ